MPSVWILGLAGVLYVPDATSLHEELARYASGTRVMYVAAHPDDEHTELLSYLASGRHAQVVYLSLTRGDGGQNRIGAEVGPALGVLRTQELLSARRIDGAEQLFTRALDFGYSKSAEETLEIWDDAAVLEDVVYAIRAFRPHVIITRFPETGDTHGHHLASARLARRAFAAAADPSVQVMGLPPWQALRLAHDVPQFMAGAGPVEGALGVPIAGFDAWRGRSFGEIAALSRSQHRSQGFGTVSERAAVSAQFVPIGGTAAQTDLLEGIQGSWSELEGGERLGRMALAASDAFDPSHPEASVAALVEVRRALSAMSASALRDELMSEADALIVACAGFFVDVRSASAAVRPGTDVTLEVELLRRTALPVRIESLTVDVRASGARSRVAALAAPIELEQGVIAAPPLAGHIPSDAAPSVLPWLAAPPERGHYLAEGLDRIAPWPAASLGADIVVNIAGISIPLRRAVRNVHADPVLGERAREVEVLPAIVLDASRPVSLAAPGGTTSVELTAHGAPGTYEVALEAASGWTLTPEQASITIGESGTADVSFMATAGEGAAPITIRPTWRVTGGTFAPALAATLLDYPHVPACTVLLPSAVRLVPVALRSLAGERWRVGYVEGTGDAVAASLSSAGMDVTTLDLPALSGDLSRFDAIVIGPRAYNATPALFTAHDALMSYADAGGTVIVQYQTVNRLETLSGPIGPAPLRIDRTRVTDEDAAVELLAADHRALTTPNAIGPADFEGWVQERGLYFGQEWDAAYTPLLRMHDPGEAPADGSLLVAAHGQGHVVYTALSFFRQLPAGTPGAYRLFENLIALGTARAGADASVPATRAEEPPPFGSWRTLYVLIAVALTVFIGFMVWLRRRYG